VRRLRSTTLKTAALLLLLFPLAPGECRAQSPFDGTWVIDTSKKENGVEEKPITFEVTGGVYRSGERVLKAEEEEKPR